MIVIGAVLAAIAAIFVILVVVAVMFGEPVAPFGEGMAQDDFTTTEGSLFSFCYEDQACPAEIEDGQLRFDVDDPNSIASIMIGSDPPEAFASATVTVMVSPGEPEPGVAGGPACGWGQGGVTVQLFGDGTLQIADVSHAEPLASTTTAALGANEAALVSITCVQDAATGDVTVQAQRVAGADAELADGDLRATVPNPGTFESIGLAAQSGADPVSVRFDEFDVSVEER
jgi:hypothetical protein